MAEKKAMKFRANKMALLLALMALPPAQVNADCGVVEPATSKESLESLLQKGSVQRLFSNKDGVFYLHYEAHCCQSGVVLAGTTLYRLSGADLTRQDVCEASGPGKRKFAYRNGSLFITDEAFCTSGSDEQCFKLLPKRQRKLDRNPIELKWDGTSWIKRTKSK